MTYSSSNFTYSTLLFPDTRVMYCSVCTVIFSCVSVQYCTIMCTCISTVLYIYIFYSTVWCTCTVTVQCTADPNVLWILFSTDTVTSDTVVQYCTAVLYSAEYPILDLYHHTLPFESLNILYCDRLILICTTVVLWCHINGPGRNIPVVMFYLQVYELWICIFIQYLYCTVQ